MTKEREGGGGLGFKHQGEWGLVSPRLHVELLKALQTVDELFTSHDIPYWLCGGTLLGAVRDGGFIPHDDDIDLEVFQRDLERIRTLCEGLPFLSFTNRTRYYDKQFGKIFFHQRKELVVDLFWREDDCPLERDFLGKEEIFPLRRIRFHDIEVNGPADPLPYLRRCYGEDCMTMCRVWTHQWNNQFRVGFSPNKEVMEVGAYRDFARSLGFRHVSITEYDQLTREDPPPASREGQQQQGMPREKEDDPAAQGPPEGKTSPSGDGPPPDSLTENFDRATLDQ